MIGILAKSLVFEVLKVKLELLRLKLEVLNVKLEPLRLKLEHQSLGDWNRGYTNETRFHRLGCDRTSASVVAITLLNADKKAQRLNTTMLPKWLLWLASRR